MQHVSQHRESDSSSWLYHTDNDPYFDPPDEEDQIAHQLSEKSRKINKSAIE